MCVYTGLLDMLYAICSDGETPVMPDYSGMRSIPSLPSLPRIWPRVVAFDRVLSMIQLEQFEIQIYFKQISYYELNS